MTTRDKFLLRTFGASRLREADSQFNPPSQLHCNCHWPPAPSSHSSSNEVACVLHDPKTRRRLDERAIAPKGVRDLLQVLGLQLGSPRYPRFLSDALLLVVVLLDDSQLVVEFRFAYKILRTTLQPGFKSN